MALWGPGPAKAALLCSLRAVGRDHGIYQGLVGGKTVRLGELVFSIPVLVTSPLLGSLSQIPKAFLPVGESCTAPPQQNSSIRVPFLQRLWCIESFVYPGLKRWVTTES